MPLNAIPEEIQQALTRGYGYFLVIKGDTGTGKTTFALEILRQSPNPYYISARMHPNFVLKQFPHVAEFLPPASLLNATQLPDFDTKTNARNAPSVSPILRFQEISEFFEGLYQQFKQQSKTGPATIVIDSWDALLEMEQASLGDSHKPSSNRFMGILADWIHSAQINLILLIECTQPTRLDAIVDGIIHLTDLRINDARLRFIEFVKMRDVHILQPGYIFTLGGSHFRYLEPYHFKLPEILLRPEPIPDLNLNTISTGMQRFDEYLQGGYVQGSWNLYELSKGVGSGFLQLLIPTLVNLLNLGRGVIATLPEGISLRNFEIYLQGFVPGDRIASQFVIFDRPPVLEEIRSKMNVLPDSLPETLAEIHKHEDLLTSYFNAPVLKILGLDKLEHVYSMDEMRKYITSEVAYVKSSQHMVLAFIKEEMPLVNTFSHLSTRHFKLELRNKVLLMRGIQPPTDYIAIRPIISEGYLDTDIVKIE